MRLLWWGSWAATDFFGAVLRGVIDGVREGRTRTRVASKRPTPAKRKRSKR